MVVPDPGRTKPLGPTTRTRSPTATRTPSAGSTRGLDLVRQFRQFHPDRRLQIPPGPPPAPPNRAVRFVGSRDGQGRPPRRANPGGLAGSCRAGGCCGASRCGRGKTKPMSPAPVDLAALRQSVAIGSSEVVIGGGPAARAFGLSGWRRRSSLTIAPEGPGLVAFRREARGRSRSGYLRPAVGPGFAPGSVEGRSARPRSPPPLRPARR